MKIHRHYVSLILMVAMIFVAACNQAKESAPVESQAEQRDRLDQESMDNVVSHDRRVVSKANEAVGEVVRSLPDCDAVKAALPEAQREIEQAQRRVRTPTGRKMVETLRHQMRKAQNFCP